MHRGYVKIWRKIEDSGLMQTPNTLALFMFILLNATHKTIKVGTPSGVIDLHRGQYISGRKELAARLKQSEQQIRTSLDRLTILGIISVNSTNRYSVYTIENYSVYQDSNQQDNQQITNSQPTDNQQITTKQEHKHINTERNIKYIPPIPAELLSEWLIVRKRKPVTERVFKSVEKEAAKIGWTPEQAIIKCCERGWTGFEAQWVSRENKTSINSKQAAAMTAFGSLLTDYIKPVEKEI